ncbi:HlyD family secretion protein [Mucilaginibacter sp. SJ]|uniref:HlyD family secretion protein n=1 Tax=Mucilaginibacter sp. SJ TaxID=3029053 RepID=UPI0023A9F3A3|nr:HlyD family efflux transporter periplasmic adaptor subunit [Mucilaginibacter sp. SJ]WEA01829.1 HlyD family efflux transporter periplasmic adaptor subunit [Mucilaginibacter sp. SJ]
MSSKQNEECESINRDLLKITSTNHLQSRSELAQEIIDRRPSFFEKWALMLFSAILLCLFGGTWFIKYPDIIEANATLSAYNAPKEIISVQTGRLIKLFVQNGQQVKKDDMIGWIESAAKPDEVLRLSAQLDSGLRLLMVGKSEKVSVLFKEQFQNLGAIQVSYQTYIMELQQFNDYLVNGFYENQKKLILNDVSSIRNTDRELKEQKQLLRKDNEVASQTYEMNQKLFDQHVITKEEYRQQQSKLFNKQLGMPQINSSIISNQNQGQHKLRELEQIDHDMAQQKVLLQQALQTLKSNVDEWKKRYILSAPMDGTLFFALELQQNQFVEQNKLLGYVKPADSKFYAQLVLPQRNLGKVDTGMQVQLRFDAYPYQEVGFIKGKINYISNIATDSGYIAKVQLKTDLKTNLGEKIRYKTGLKATALVITKDMPLIKRLYFTVVKATSQGK